MAAAGRPSNVADMAERDRVDGLRGTELAEKLAIGKQERQMADVEQALARELRELEETEDRAQKEIADELRREHWGHEPDRPFRRPNHRH
jgi:hypothetical protein